MQLMREMCAEIDRLYGNTVPTAFEVHGMDRPGAAFIIARELGQPVACAALRPISAEIAEVKRMYVRPEMRRKGVARQLMVTLEQIASDSGFRKIWLETGLPQVGAIRLYEQLGYTTIPSYGKYKDERENVCYAKSL